MANNDALFTPVFDVIVDELGKNIAIAFGIIWRYCQMENGSCSASVEKMSGRAGIHRTTMMQYIKSLCDNGYILDTTPDLRNHTHTYLDTGKVRIEATLRAVAKSDTGVAKTDSPLSENARPAVGKHDMKIQDKIQNKKQVKKGDYLDALIEYKSPDEDAVEDVFLELERRLHIKITRNGENQSIAKWIVKEGVERLTSWISWYLSDEFRAEKQVVYFKMEIIRTTWDLAKAHSGNVVQQDNTRKDGKQSGFFG